MSFFTLLLDRGGINSDGCSADACAVSAAALGLLMSAQKPTSEELEQNFAAITTLRKAEWARAYAESGEQRRWPVSAEQEAHWRMDKLYSANAAMLPYVGVAMVTCEWALRVPVQTQARAWVADMYRSVQFYRKRVHHRV